MSDKFLSEEDLDLKNLTFEELIAVWNQWLIMAQSTNDYDKDRYSHSCFGEFINFPSQDKNMKDKNKKVNF